jgi:hypothetical protein
LEDEKMENPKKRRNLLAPIILALIIIVVVAGISVYYITTQTNLTTKQSVNPNTATPTASPGATGSPSETPTNVAQANSLKYSVSVSTSDGTATSYTYWGKKAASGELMMRIESQTTDGKMIYIFNGAQHKAWMMINNEWTDISDSFNSDYSTWDNTWSSYVNTLGTDWSGTGDYTYSAAGTTFRIYDISVNPSLDDSLFVH